MKCKLIFFSAIVVLIKSNSYAQNKNIFINKKFNQKIYHEGWVDFNKNGKKDIYESVEYTIEERIEDLIQQMDTIEKACQLVTLYGFGRVAKDELPTENWKNEIWKDGLANIDEHLNGLAYHPKAKTEYSWPPSNHAKAINEVQKFFVEETRLGIPVDFTNEGIRGLCHQGSTCFPAQIGVGSTWNKELINQIGKITGSEARALGYTNVYSPILDLARDPRWGRVVECYGEDPFLVGELGKQMTLGLQSQNVISTAKHYAVYSVPKGGRDGDARTDPHVAPREVHQMYLYPFRKAVKEAGLLGIMSSYNDYDAIPITASHYFLQEILRDNWGFKGYVVSDSWAVGGLEGRHKIASNYKETVKLSVNAGLNVRTNFTPPNDFVDPLLELIKEGEITMETLNKRVKDVLYVKFKLGLFDNPYVSDPANADNLIHKKESEEIALKASREALVLLKNDGLLPLDTEKLNSILVTGPNAKAINHAISRYGPSEINVVSIYEGIKQQVNPKVEVNYAKGCDFFDSNWPENEIIEIPVSEQQQKLIDEAVKQAQDVDVIIAVMGDDEETVGESRSRTSLNLPGNQLDLLKALHSTGKPVVLVLVNGRALSINWSNKYLPAIIESWFPGEYGGTAVAEALFGKYNPGGKLPVTFPKSVGQIMYNFPYKPSSQVDQPKTGMNAFVPTRVDGALYPFGYGLSYSNFEFSNLKLSRTEINKDTEIEIKVDVKNTGNYDGDEVVQLYIRDLVSSVVTYEKVLRGFERIHLRRGETKTVTFILKPDHLKLLNQNFVEVVEPGKFEVIIGNSSIDERLKETFEFECPGPL